MGNHSAAGSAESTVTLSADARGHFMTKGQIMTLTKKY